MAGTKRVFLHIGAPKTGTTYLQAVFAHNRAALRSRGILYPTGIAGAHHTAAWDLRGTPAQRTGAQGIEGAWAALVAAAHGWHGHTVIVSSELLVFCDEKQITTALEAFDAEVHVVYTARDLVRQVPAAWQERIKNQQTLTYREFVDSVVRPGKKSARHGFWRAQDASAVLGRWSVGLAPSRVHVVTTPPATGPRTVLLERFASVFGLRAADLATDTPSQANESLGLLQTELLRRYNERHGKDLPWPLYRRTIRLQLGSAFGAIHDDRKLALTPSERAFLVERATAMVDALARPGFDVVGDLRDLVPAEQPRDEQGAGRPTDTAAVTETELLAAAVDVMHAVLSGEELERQEAKRAAKRPHRDRSDVSDA